MQIDDVTESIGRLSDFSLLESDVGKYVLKPTLISYIFSNMDDETKKNYMINICDYYIGQLHEFYKIVSLKPK